MVSEFIFLYIEDCISVLTSSVVDLWFEPQLDQTKYSKIWNCSFPAKHTALLSKGKDWLVRNQGNVSEWNDMCTNELLLQWATTIKIQLRALVVCKADIIEMGLVLAMIYMHNIIRYWKNSCQSGKYHLAMFNCFTFLRLDLFLSSCTL